MRLAAGASTRVGVAVSAGCDSCALATLLARLRPHLGIRKLVLLHLDHGLRPAAERRRDLEVLRRLAKRARTPLVVGRARVRAGGKGLEDAARSARLKFFARAVRRLRLGSIAVAHHLDDRIETFFLFLLRGSGSRGLSSLRAVETLDRPGPIRIVRPLLPFTRADIRQFAASEKIEYHEDSTNIDPGFLRNRIRIELVPLLGEWHPQFRLAMAATISALESEDAALSELAKSIIQSCGHAENGAGHGWPSVERDMDVNRSTAPKNSMSLDRRRLRLFPSALLARALQQADRSLGGSGLLGGHENLSAAVRAILGKSAAVIDLSGGRHLRMDRDRVIFSVAPGPARRRPRTYV